MSLFSNEYQVELTTLNDMVLQSSNYIMLSYALQIFDWLIHVTKYSNSVRKIHIFSRWFTIPINLLGSEVPKLLFALIFTLTLSIDLGQ